MRYNSQIRVASQVRVFRVRNVTGLPLGISLEVLEEGSVLELLVQYKAFLESVQPKVRRIGRFAARNGKFAGFHYLAVLRSVVD
jgi:hypothetical protein